MKNKITAGIVLLLLAIVGGGYALLSPEGESGDIFSATEGLEASSEGRESDGDSFAEARARSAKGSESSGSSNDDSDQTSGGKKRKRKDSDLDKSVENSGSSTGSGKRSGSSKGSTTEDDTKLDPEAVKSITAKSANDLNEENGELRAGFPTKEAEDPSKDTLKILSSRSWSKERFEQRFTNRNEDAPKAVLTDLSGKIMDGGSRKGMPNARVILHSYFPASSVRGAVITPVATELTTNDKGEFNGKVPLPDVKLSDYPSLSVTVFGVYSAIDNRGEIQEVEKTVEIPAMSFTSKRVPEELMILGQPVRSLKAGERTTLGIFWTPRTAYSHAEVFEFASKGYNLNSLKVYATGGIDASRWSEGSHKDALASLPSTSLSEESSLLRLINETHGDRNDFFLLSSGESVLEAESAVDGEGFDLYGKIVTRRSVHFAPKDGSVVSGQVVAPDFANVDNATIRVIAPGEDTYYPVQPGGWFTLTAVPKDLIALQAWHEDWCAVEVPAKNAKSGDALTINFKDLRPRWRFNVKNGQTQEIIKTARFTYRYWELRNDGSTKYKARWAKPDLSSETGEFLLESEWNIDRLLVSAIGFEAIRVKVPPTSEITEVLLPPSVTLNISPQAYSFAKENAYKDGEGNERKTQWFKLSDGTNHVYTAWGNLPIEYDFSVIPEGVHPDDMEAKRFDLVLGARNQGIVENSFEFLVDVYVDGKKRGRLRIPADSANERTGSINLGNLAANHKLRLVWVNDSWIPSELDANIRLTSIRIFQVTPS